TYHYRFDFVDAGQLVTGDLVRIGGTPAGTVDSISLTPNGLAQVGVSLDSSFGPLRQGTTAVIRETGLTSVASRYIDISPAPTFDQFLNQTSQALGDIDQRSAQLTDLISQAKVTMQALSSDNQSLSQALMNLPGALRNGAATFARMRTATLPALSRLVNATRP